MLDTYVEHGWYSLSNLEIAGQYGFAFSFDKKKNSWFSFVVGPRNFSFLPMFFCFHWRPACFSDSWKRLGFRFALPWFAHGFPMVFPWVSPWVFQAKMESDLLPFSDASTTDADSISRCSRCVQLDEAWKHSRFYQWPGDGETAIPGTTIKTMDSEWTVSPSNGFTIGFSMFFF